MRILMVAARCYPLIGGIETHIQEVGPRLVTLGHAVDVLTTDPSGELPVEEEVRGMRVRRVRAWPRELDLYFAPRIYTAIRRGTWDLIHFQGYNTFVAPIGLFAAVRGDLPFILTFHSGGHSSRLRNTVRGTQHALLRPLVAQAARLIGVSEFEASFFSGRMGVPRERFVVIPNGAAMPAPSPGIKVDPHLIVSGGRLERYKGHHRVIGALPELIRRVPDARLHVVGTGPYERELRRLVAMLGLEKRVTIAGIPGSERQKMADLLARAALFVLFSDYEAHPIAVMEALSLRRPVLVSDTSGLRELAAKGLCRAIPPNAGPKELAAAMADELKAHREVPDLALPDWDACAQVLSDVYCDVLSSRSVVRLPPGGVMSWPPATGV
ncbi:MULTISPECIES: glycosyltransferase family 4 protein [unclassified Mesorhizobium]|uniref:glycosyltransferase family 4 protein n=1 Tax=unclassified Mesorhizobium TaxID=325217 RepID=UPI000F760DF8|nr:MULTISPECIES: glycosyltransferase family 4 protein [unclassified Mesorhizobium]RUU44394.1 glycosyltransferase [Mesorhizobium sp. M6A.T.Ca.TU.002.02.2.1]AZO63584.1 glycosyltransferase family 1 protein [Mesorhizobium sp. M6A.T.Cr.TU.016.01.1.1]RUU31618.1 glycosyltransferase [Mesorhizobium sp. M6A.T.Ce.TU.016.01.1.1]RWP51648.1 MAG: glycosyltransferase [Mesorhizobium sp.]RWP53584.1 MAG: glycosyltransferase [Mesorhizobium sp.]